MEAWPSRTIYSPEHGTCVQQHTFKRVYYTLVATTLFVAPVLIMLASYSAIIWKLGSRHGSPVCLSLASSASGQLSALRHKAKRKIVKMAVAILLVFILCWLPLQIIVLYSIYWHSSSSDGAVSIYSDTLKCVVHIVQCTVYNV